MADQPKMIVLTGHGAWQTKARNRNAFTKMPAKCSINFYTTNFTLMYSTFGDEIDTGKVGAYTPSQQAGPYMAAPNMVLTWPRGLTIPAPPKSWAKVVYEKGVTIPRDSRNIQFQIKKPENPLGNMLLDPLGHMCLEDILKILEPAIAEAKSVLFLWSACRQVMLAEAKGLVKQKVTSDPEEIDDFVECLETLVKDAGMTSLGLKSLAWRMKTWGNRIMSVEQIMEELDEGLARVLLEDLVDVGGTESHGFSCELQGEILHREILFQVGFYSHVVAPHPGAPIPSDSLDHSIDLVAEVALDFGDRLRAQEFPEKRLGPVGGPQLDVAFIAQVEQHCVELDDRLPGVGVVLVRPQLLEDLIERVDCSLPVSNPYVALEGLFLVIGVVIGALLLVLDVVVEKNFTVPEEDLVLQNLPGSLVARRKICQRGLHIAKGNRRRQARLMADVVLQLLQVPQDVTHLEQIRLENHHESAWFDLHGKMLQPGSREAAVRDAPGHEGCGALGLDSGTSDHLEIVDLEDRDQQVPVRDVDSESAQPLRRLVSPGKIAGYETIEKALLVHRQGKAQLLLRLLPVAVYADHGSVDVPEMPQVTHLSGILGSYENAEILQGFHQSVDQRGAGN